MNKLHKSWMVNLFSIILILGSFTLASLLLIDTGMCTYKNIVLANNDNFKLRTSLSYIATKVRQTDTLDSAYLEKKSRTDVLVLGEKIEGKNYETRIYYYKGYLYELFTEKGMEYDLTYGMPMIEISNFKMEETKEGFLRFTAINKEGDSQMLLLSPRSGRAVKYR
jgi:hypothetical protein